MALLPKGGLQVAGHKIPWEAIAALAGVAGVILVIRARQQGQSVASVGQAPASPYTAASTGFGNFSPDYSGALANISQQLTNLQQSSVNSPPSPPASTTAPPTTVHGHIDPTPANQVVIAPFPQWLAGAFTGARPDLAAAIAQGRNADIAGEYAKEVAQSESGQLAAGRQF